MNDELRAYPNRHIVFPTYEEYLLMKKLVDVLHALNSQRDASPVGMTIRRKYKIVIPRYEESLPRKKLVEFPDCNTYETPPSPAC